MTKKKESPDLRLLKKPEDFAAAFIEKYRSSLRVSLYKYVVPNRYTVDDIISYLSIKIIEVLKRAKAKNKKIVNREGYFLQCARLYAADFRREHGWVLGLPKKKSKKWAANEEDIVNNPATYISHLDSPESLEAPVSSSEENDEIWEEILAHVSELEATILDMHFRRGLNITQISRELCINRPRCALSFKIALSKIEGIAGYVQELINLPRD